MFYHIMSHENHQIQYIRSCYGSTSPCYGDKFRHAANSLTQVQHVPLGVASFPGWSYKYLGLQTPVVICMYVCTHACMYVCMCICICIHHCIIWIYIYIYTHQNLSSVMNQHCKLWGLILWNMQTGCLGSFTPNMRFQELFQGHICGYTPSLDKTIMHVATIIYG